MNYGQKDYEQHKEIKLYIKNKELLYHQIIFGFKVIINNALMILEE